MDSDRNLGELLGQMTFWVLLIGGLIWFLVHLARRGGRAHRGAQGTAPARWQHALQVCATNPQFKLAHVTSVTQVYPNRGTQAQITWHGTTGARDAWFEQAFPPQGSWVVVSGSDNGSHGQHPSTFYVDRVYDVIA